MNILDHINSPEDLRALPEEELPALCEEIRHYMVETVSETGGHLASNLGVVELTVALHRVYDTSKDRLVFDVGHQSYVHKILTGRREAMHSLRQKGGISGFPKPNESVHDAFIAGHASNSISVALGMARARTLTGGDYKVVALIGDGALTGGLAYEGLSNAGQSGEPLVIVLNDNGMSIERNVGGTARLLSRMRLRPGYLAFKRSYRRFTQKIPFVYKVTHSVKEWVKSKILPASMFDEMGFAYIGPVNGHDLEELETVLTWARDLNAPVVVHVITQKGKGYAKAEAEPNLYHGVGAFDPELGVEKTEKEDFSRTFGTALYQLARKDQEIVAITAAMAEGTGLTRFENNLSHRFFDVGIAEGHGVAMAAGMAKQGLKPVVAIYSTFLQRSYDMLIHDVALQKLHVVFGVDRAGIVGSDGETHNGAFDVGYLCSVPNMAVLCPASYAELQEMLELALYRVKGPVALRYPRGGEGAYTESHAREPYVTLRAGTDITIVTYGTLVNNVLEAAELLSLNELSAEVIKLNVINPLDAAALAVQIAKTGCLLVVEDTCAQGCVGRRIEAAIAAAGGQLKAAKLVNLGDGILQHGTVSEVQQDCGMDARSLTLTAAELIRSSV